MFQSLRKSLSSIYFSSILAALLMLGVYACGGDDPLEPEIAQDTVTEDASQEPRAQEEYKAYEGDWLNAFNAFAGRSDKSTPITDELLRLRYPLSMPQPIFSASDGKMPDGAGVVGQVKMSPVQYWKMVQAMNTVTVNGETMRDAFDSLVQSPLYERAVRDKDKIYLLSSKRSEFLEAAKRSMRDPSSEWYDDELADWVLQAIEDDRQGISFEPTPQ